MANMLGRTKSLDETRSLPKGESVGSYSSYLDAQKAVDYLADQQFPVQTVSILGNELKTVERVTGRLTYPRVALAGAATGAWFGLFVGVVLMLFGSSDAYFLILSSMALGAGFWMLFGVITYALQRGKRDFTSTSQVVATNYDVLVAPDAAGEARRLLQQLPMNGRPAHTSPAGPTYGGTGAAGPEQGTATGVYGGAQGGQPSQPPERPAGWEDPYGQPQAGQTAQPQAGQQGASGQPVDAAPAGGQRAAQDDRTVPRGRFPDLPDGRPQYGERLPPAGEQPGQTTAQQPINQPAQQPEVQQPAAEQPAAEQQPAAEGTATGAQDSAKKPDEKTDDTPPYDQDQNNRR